MANDVVHRAALEALIATAVSPPLWRNKSDLASACGLTLSTISNVLTGRRGLSERSLDAIADGFSRALDCEQDLFRRALRVPWVARPGDLRTVQIERRLGGVQDELTSLLQEFRNYQRGD